MSRPLPTAAGPSRSSGRGAVVYRIGLALLGAAFGVSQIVHGAYDESTWAPIALGALALVLALTVGVPRRLPLGAILPLLGLWLWCLISAGWSDSSDFAHIAADRWLLYASAFALLCWAVGSDRRRASVLLGGTSLGVLGVAVWMLIRMLAGHGPALFLGARLNDPLGYVNGQAGYLLIGVWPCLALAERRGSRMAALLAGVGVAGAVLLTGLGLLTQSRSWGIALIGTTLLLLAGVPGRARRVGVVLVIGAALTLSYSALSSVWRHPSPLDGLPTVANTRHAAATILLAALAAGVMWTVLVGTLEGLAPARSPQRARVSRLASAGLAVLALALVAAIGVSAGSITHRIHTQYDAFVHLAPSPGSTRLLSGGGTRYDYWRVALLEFRSAPVRGVGAGNYQPGWYLHRHTAEAIQQPHSLELQTLAELGLVGALLLLAFLAAAAVGFVRTSRVARADHLARTVAVGAGGAFIAWLTQTSVDWLHLFPGLTAIALAAVVAMVARPDPRAETLGPRPRWLAVAVAAVIGVAGALTIVPRVLALHSTTLAQHALAQGKPRTAIADATRALDYDPSSVPALVLRAAGLARLHAFFPTLADIRRATEVEPHNWTTWAVLGDLLTRRGERPAARAAYVHALRLDPLESSLKEALTSRAVASRG